ncbi:hypothetical protein F4677DRAFT_439987 [Hypoxylon crocopeplum]|nr:hypothetical protein F4677DRAFT_439987 [Hypoxylon crocopeplum]
MSFHNSPPCECRVPQPCQYRSTFGAPYQTSPYPHTTIFCRVCLRPFFPSRERDISPLSPTLSTSSYLPRSATFTSYNAYYHGMHDGYHAAYGEPSPATQQSLYHQRAPASYDINYPYYYPEIQATSSVQANYTTSISRHHQQPFHIPLSRPVNLEQQLRLPPRSPTRHPSLAPPVPDSPGNRRRSLPTPARIITLLGEESNPSSTETGAESQDRADPTFWVERRDRSGEGGSLSSSSISSISSGSDAIAEGTPPIEALPPSPIYDASDEEEVEGRESLRITEDGEFILGDEWQVPDRATALAEARSPWGTVTIRSAQEAIDEGGNAISYEIEEDGILAELTMSGGLA